MFVQNYLTKEALRLFLCQNFHSACATSRKPGKLLFGNDLAKTLQELKTTTLNEIMTNNSSDARNYKRSTSHTKQENIMKISAEAFFGEQREDFQFSQINYNSGLSLIQEKVHQDLEILKTQVSVFPCYVKDHLIPYLRLRVQSFRAGQVSLFYEKWMQ